MVSVVPANEAGWEDLQAIFGTRGEGRWCQCQRYKLERRESFRSRPVRGREGRVREENRRERTRCGHPQAEATSGLVAYVEGEPAGWCAVEPRSAYTGLARN